MFRYKNTTVEKVREQIEKMNEKLLLDKTRQKEFLNLIKEQGLAENDSKTDSQIINDHVGSYSPECVKQQGDDVVFIPICNH